MNTIITKKLAVMSVSSLVLAASLTAKADTAVYLNDTSDTSQSLNFQNGWTIGNEILLGAPTTISSFDFEYYSPTSTPFVGTVTMTISLYANDGAIVAGYPSPGTSLFSDSFTLLPPYTPLGSGGYANIIGETPNVLVPSDFTLAITISGLSGTDTVGLELYNAVTVGSVYNDYWLNTGGGYQLLQTPASGPNNFGARFFTADVPEPSSIGFAVAGGLLLALNFRKRQSAQIAAK